MQKINFQDLPNTTTPVNASNLNQVQTNVEDVFNGSEPMGNIVVDSIETSNKLNIYDFISDTAIANVTQNQVVLTSSASFSTAYVEVKGLKPNTQYTISANFEQQGTTTTIRLSPRYLENPSGEVNPVNAATTSGVINTTISTSNSGDLRIYFYSNFTSSAVNSQLKLTNVQLKEGTTVQTYSIYQNLNSTEAISLKSTLSNDNLNKYITNGVYYIVDSNTNQPTSYAMLIVLTLAGDTVQMAIGISTNIIYVRTHYGTTWTNWRTI